MTMTYVVPAVTLLVGGVASAGLATFAVTAAAAGDWKLALAGGVGAAAVLLWDRLTPMVAPEEDEIECEDIATGGQPALATTAGRTWSLCPCSGN